MQNNRQLQSWMCVDKFKKSNIWVTVSLIMEGLLHYQLFYNTLIIFSIKFLLYLSNITFPAGYNIIPLCRKSTVKITGSCTPLSVVTVYEV